MPTHVVISNTYDGVEPATLWALATDFEALSEVCKPYVTFEGLPYGRVEDGMRIEVLVRLFGRLPPQTYHMEVEGLDNQNMWLRSLEYGAGVKSWRHYLRVEPTQSGARLTDEIDIDAGFMTPLFALWAKLLYSNRHGRRLKLLSQLKTA